MKGNRRGVWVALGGAALTFIGALLPWVTGPFGISASGTSGDGIIAIILSVPMAVFAWLTMRRRWAAVVTIVVSVLTVALMVFEVIHISSASYAIGTSSIGITLGIGVIVCLVGGAAGLVGGVLARRDFVVPEVMTGPLFVPPPPPPATMTTTSPDGRWWWDGHQWQPVVARPPATP